MTRTMTVTVMLIATIVNNHGYNKSSKYNTVDNISCDSIIHDTKKAQKP